MRAFLPGAAEGGDGRRGEGLNMAVTRRGFAKAVGAAVPFAAASAAAKESPLPEQNPGEFVLQQTVKNLSVKPQ